MDPPDGFNSLPAEGPVDELIATEAQTTDHDAAAPPVTLVSMLTIDTDPKETPTSEADNSIATGLSTTTPLTVFKQAPEAQIESANTAPQQAKNLRICGVCNKEPGKYKCPRCGLYYCSVPCSKAHKADHPPDAPPPSQPPPAPQISGTKRPREPEDPYSVLLEHRADLERLFAKYPNLESDLVQIERATLPPADVFPPAGGLPTRYQPPHQHRQQEPWTRQVGLRKGAAALKKARTDPSEDGDAVREYCELVLHLLSASRERRESEALDAVRRETADEERGVIKKLIRMEDE